MSVPESFTAAERFHIDSVRSPTTPDSESSAPAMTACTSGNFGKKLKWMPTATSIDEARPPISPSTLFLGLMRGERRRLPKFLPT